MNFLITTLEQGLIYAIMGLGVYITYKILDFPDMTVDGCFPMGAAVTAAMITRGVNPYLTLIIAFLAGMLAGICTGLIHVKAKVRDLLSGIIMMTALWSINLLIAGTSNVPLFSQNSIFNNYFVDNLFVGGLSKLKALIIIALIVVIVKILLDLFLKTKSGYLLRAVGDNDTLVTSLAKDKGNVKIMGLAISNGLVALAGCLFAQEERVFEISSGTGAIVIGIASVIIGSSLLKKFNFLSASAAVIIGSIFYKVCVGFATSFADPWAVKLTTAAIFLIILVIADRRKTKVNKHARA
ncbi:MAG: ABC transporter permease [Suipraeoptans sp.]